MQQERVVEIVDSESTPSSASRSAQGAKAQRAKGVKPKTTTNDSSSEKTDRNSDASTVRDVCHDGVRISSRHRNAAPDEIKEIMHESSYSSSSLAESKLFDVQNEETFDSDMVLPTRISNRLFNQLFIVEYCAFFFATIGMLISVWLYEMRQLGLNDSLPYQCALYYNMVCTLALMFSIYTRYDLQLRFFITTDKFTSYDTLFNTGIWKSMVVEIALNAFAPYPFLDGITYIEDVPDFEA